MTRAGSIADKELFSNAAGCDAVCAAVPAGAKSACLQNCEAATKKSSTPQNWGGILSGFAELVNAGGGIYATHVAAKGGQYIPNYNYGANAFDPALGGEVPLTDEDRKRKNRNTILIGAGVVLLLGVGAYFALKAD